MNIEAAFLDAIRAAPKDRTSRIVYADWLEEQADSRGELIRIEEAMRRLPIFSDSYWQLKTRREELRRQADPDWLQTMRYGTDCQPVFRHGIPDGWKERWRLIREYVDRWHRLPLGDVGGRIDEIRATEARLGRTLSPSVREWVAFAHDVRQEDNYHEVLRDFYMMEELKGLSAVSLLLQCEGDYHWAIRHADFDLPDPPVCEFQLDFENGDEKTFVPAQASHRATTLTSFALRYAMDYTHAEGGGFGTDVVEAIPLLRDLKIAFPVRSRLGDTEIFEMDNILVRVSPSHQLSGKYLEVEVARPLPREAIPAFLWNYTRNGGHFHGLFTPDRRRDQDHDSPAYEG